MTRFLTVAFLAGAGVFCGYAIAHRPQPAAAHWSWMRHADADIEDRRQDLGALLADLDQQERRATLSTATAPFGAAAKKIRGAR